MPTVTRTFTTRAQPAAVVDYLKDFTHAVEWDPGTERCEQTSPGPIQVGTQFHNESKIAGVSTELTYTLEELTDSSVVLVGVNDSATSTDTITVRPADGGSEVTYEAKIEPKGAGKLAEPVMKIVFERIGTKTEENLIEVLDRLA